MTTMLIDTEQGTPGTRGLPADLRQHLGERALIELALEAVQTVAARWSLPVEPEGRFRRQMLFTLLTYCYAAGVYGSEDIEYDCRNDAAVRYLCANAAPDQDTIRTFRRANRPWIEECLVCVYGKACGLKSVEMGSEPVVAAAFQAEQRPDIANFVRRKLELAIMIDTAMCE